MVQGDGCQVFVGSRVVIDLVLNAGLSAFATVLNGLLTVRIAQLNR